MELVNKGVRLIALPLGWMWFAVFLDHYRKGRDEQALEAVQKFDMPRLWITHAFSVAASGQLGMKDEAQGAVSQLLKLRPRFPEEAKVAIRRFVVSPDLTDRLVEGLRKAGLDILDEPTAAT